MIQLQVLNYILKTKDSSLLLVNNINKEFFSDYTNEYEYIIDHLKSDIETESALTLNELCAILKRTKSRGENSYMFKASRFMSLERSIKAVFPLHYAHMMIIVL